MNPLTQVLEILRSGTPDAVERALLVGELYRRRDDDEPRGFLRSLVDVVWQTATESEAVPSTDWADRMIAQARNAPDAACRPRPTTGAEMIADERARQVGLEGWDPAHDDKHTDDEMAWAAVCYAAPSRVQAERKWPGDWIDPWPWDRKWDKRKKHSRLRCLVIAGALIAAEIDRFLRRGEVA